MSQCRHLDSGFTHNQRDFVFLGTCVIQQFYLKCDTAFWDIACISKGLNIMAHKLTFIFLVAVWKVNDGNKSYALFKEKRTPALPGIEM